MDEFTVFAIDARNYKVLCSERQLAHVYEHHPELRNFWATERDLAFAIANATSIYQSVKGPQYNIYYLGKAGKNTELKVVVKFDWRTNTGTLWAAQPSSVGQRKKGEILIWPKLNA